MSVVSSQRLGNIVWTSRRVFDLVEQKKLAPRRSFSFKREQNVSMTVVLPVPAIPLSQRTWDESLAVAHSSSVDKRETRVPCVHPGRSSCLNSAPTTCPSLSRTARRCCRIKMNRSKERFRTDYCCLCEQYC